MSKDNCDTCGQALPKTTEQLRADFKERLELAHDALDTFAEKRLVSTSFDPELRTCRAAVEAVLRFGISGSLYDPKVDERKVPTVGFIKPLTDDDATKEKGETPCL